MYYYEYEIKYNLILMMTFRSSEVFTFFCIFINVIKSGSPVLGFTRKIIKLLYNKD